MSKLNAFDRGIYLRQKLVKDGKILCVDFASTLQKQDLTKGTIQDVDTKAYPYRSKVNVKEFDDEVRKSKGLEPFDFSDRKAIYDAMKTEFDIPLWFMRKAGDNLDNIQHYNLRLVYQLMGCNFHDGTKSGGCIFCFVDDKSNVPDASKGVYLSVDNILNTFEAVKDERDICGIRTSGGEPTLILDHILNLYREMDNRGIDPLLAQFDTNLSTGKLIEHFEDNGEYEKNILDKIAEFDPKVLAAFKGTDDSSIQKNIQANCRLEDQIYSLKKIVKAGLDVYPYVYNPDPNNLVGFIDRLEKDFENITPKIHVGLLKDYSPNEERVKLKAIDEGKDPEKAWEKQKAIWASNYSKSCEIMNNLLNSRYGVDYKQLERPLIRVKAK